MRGRFAPFVVGIGLLGLALLMFFFVLYALTMQEPWQGFLFTALVTGAIGIPLYKLGTAQGEPSRREALIGVVLLWLLLPLFGGMPFALSGGLSPLNAFFESMSGFTTTGATVLRDFSSFSSSLFLWRSLTQWLGGVGIIVLFVAVFPQLAIAGRQLFFAEAPGPSEEKLTPRLRHTASAVLGVYLVITTACILVYWLGGMSLYQAICHAFTTLAAGGFSPNPNSFQDFNSPFLDWSAVLFMALAGANFSLFYQAFTGKPKNLWQDAEFRMYLGIAVVISLGAAFALREIYSTQDALRHGFFQVLSIMTTTGYASVDFAAWPLAAQVLLVVVMFTGASAGSAGGGIKIIRLLIVAKNTAREIRRTLHPRAVVPVRVGGRIIPEEVLRDVAAFITLYVGLFAFVTVVLVIFGSGFVEAFTASIACLGNIGPGLGAVGPMANFADLHPVSRGALIFAMYAGRLEVIAVFVIFDPLWWRVPRQFLKGSWGRKA
jgi:trk system potassium uptake protein